MGARRHSFPPRELAQKLLIIISLSLLCLPRLEALQVAGGDTMLRLRKTMTNHTSVTVSTRRCASPPRPGLPFTVLHILKPAFQLHASSCCCHCCHHCCCMERKQVVGTHPGYPARLFSGALTSCLCLSSIVPLLYLLKIHPRLLSLFQRVINKSITQNPPTKVLGFCDFSFVSFVSFVFLSCPAENI